MKIIMAGRYGFCMGVTRAVSLLRELVQENPGRKIVTIGAFIHNPDFLKEIGEMGVDIVESDALLEPGTIAVIRTHGLPPDRIDFFRQQGVELVDATCPRVRSSQKLISKFAQDRPLIVVGDDRHAEVVSLCGFAEESYVIHAAEEAENLQLERAMVVAQTTISPAEYEAVCAVLERNIPDLIIKQTVCDATQSRQSALVDLFPDVDAVVVVGGRESSNTTRLYQIAKESGRPAFHVENELEITAEMAAFDAVGVTAGASTPEETVVKVCDRLNALA